MNTYLRRTPLHLLALTLFLCAPTTLDAQAQQAGTPSVSTPPDSAAVLAARSTYRAVEAAINAGQLAQRDTTFECDAAGVVRRLTWSGGSDHQAVTRSYHYDERARLRFAFQQQRTMNGTVLEERVYYDGGGQVVRRLRKRVRGPGWASTDVDAAADPVEWVQHFCDQ